MTMTAPMAIFPREPVREARQPPGGVPGGVVAAAFTGDFRVGGFSRAGGSGSSGIIIRGSWAFSALTAAGFRAGGASGATGSGSSVGICGSGAAPAFSSPESFPAASSGALGFFARDCFVFFGAATGVSGAGAGASGDFPTIVPHEEQNRAPGSRRVPQSEQDGGGAIRAPQASQNAFPSGTGAWHLGQAIVFFFGPGSFIPAHPLTER